jgi:hypothetical protein
VDWVGYTSEELVQLKKSKVAMPLAKIYDALYLVSKKENSSERTVL